MATIEELKSRAQKAQLEQKLLQEAEIVEALGSLKVWLREQIDCDDLISSVDASVAVGDFQHRAYIHIELLGHWPVTASARQTRGQPWQWLDRNNRPSNQQQWVVRGVDNTHHDSIGEALLEAEKEPM